MKCKREIVVYDAADHEAIFANLGYADYVLERMLTLVYYQG